MLIRHEIDTLDRFQTSDKLCAYAGLVPSTYSSGGKTHHGGIIKQGNKYLRWALIKAVVHAIRADAQLRSYYESMKLKKGANAAKVATARRLLKIIIRFGKRKDHIEYSHHYGPLSSPPNVPDLSGAFLNKG